MPNLFQGIHRIVVVGLGVTGLSVVRYLQQLDCDLQIQVNDSRISPPGLDELDSQIDVHVGSWNSDWLLEADLLVVNPGIALATPILVEAQKAGVQIVGDIELFAWALTQRKVAPKVVAITGSNGKSTVTDLTGKLANAAGMKALIGGNIGVPALDLLAEDADLYVLELSSFQLETTHNLHLDAAAFLNFTEDHMDRYDDLHGYLKAKQRIFKHAQIAVVNRDDKATYPEFDDVELKTFGSDSQRFGLLNHHGALSLWIDPSLSIPVERLQLVGQHNYTNALVALALLESVGVDLKQQLALPSSPLYQALTCYNGLAHRCQLVKESNGVRWINDSKATNVASTEAALSGLFVEGRLHLLVGGMGKGADFSPLKPLFEQYQLCLHCFGQNAAKLSVLHPSAKQWDTLDQAIAYISTQVKPKDVVLLSPACASLDQYKNFMARGDAFIQLVSQYTN